MILYLFYSHDTDGRQSTANEFTAENDTYLRQHPRKLRGSQRSGTKADLLYATQSLDVLALNVMPPFVL